MKHNYILKFLVYIFFCLACQFTEAQTFEEILSTSESDIQTDFPGVDYASLSFADVDNDNDEDLIIIGQNSSYEPITKLYLSDGNGGYSELESAPFNPVSNGVVAFSDVDGDSDLDVLISNNSSSDLYKNDGNGNFSLVSGTSFIGVRKWGHVKFFDANSDGSEDLLLVHDWDWEVGTLYINDGNGNFSGVSGISFGGPYNYSVAIGDLDNDNDEDILIAVRDFDATPREFLKYYKNDGRGNYSETPGYPFEVLSGSTIVIEDVDNDSDVDVLMSGYSTNTYEPVTNLYLNEGNGNFSLSTSNSFVGVQDGILIFEDVDGDSDLDLYIAGEDDSYNLISKLYINDGVGNFTELEAPFVGVNNGAVDFSDMDLDGDKDLLVIGETDNGVTISRVYSNDGAGNFTEVSDRLFEGVEYGSTAFADVDGDNDQDVLITGESHSGRISKLYKNDGSGNYTEVSGTPFEEVRNSSIAFTDVNGDNDEDILITGLSNSSGRISQLYKNNGSGNYTEVIDTPFEGVYSGSIAFADVDGDNDQDVLITGSGNSARISKLYENDGSGNYTEVSGTPFEGVTNSFIAFADVDGDNDQDVLITGAGNSGPISKLYENDNSGNYTEVSNTPFEGVNSGSIAFADVDGDNDQDVLITGYGNSGRISKLYENDGSGNYAEESNTPFEGVNSGSIAFADVDGDNDRDVLITGYSNSGRISKLYGNDGSGNYTEVTDTPFDGVSNSSIALADVDGDIDFDVLIAGRTVDNVVTKLYRNTTVIDLTVPSGYTIGLDQSQINFENVSAVGFTFSDAEVGATYNYTFSSSGGGNEITGSGTISTATDQITGIDLGSLGDGTITLSVTLTDPSGNTGEAVTDTAEKDTIAPSGYTVAIDQENINSESKTAVSFTFSAAEIGTTFNYTFSSTGGGNDITGSGTISTGADQITGVDLSNLSDGTITLSVTLTDTAGNIGDAVTDTVEKDTIAPSGYTVRINQGEISTENESALDFTFSGAEVGTTYNYTISSSGGESEITGTGTISTAIDQITGIDVSALGDGTLTISVTLIDPSGNTGEAVTDTAEKDTTAPSVYSVVIDQNSINSTNEASVSFTFSDAEAGATYNYTFSSSGGGSEITGSGTITTETDQTTGIDLSSLADGTITLAVTLTDPAGNTGAPVTDTSEKDTTAPSGYAVSIDQDYINFENEAAVSFTVSSAEVGATYNYSFISSGGEGEISGSGTIATVTDQITGIDLSSLPDGTLTLSVSLKDTSGNSEDVVKDTVEKDTTAPSGYSVSIDQNEINSENQTALSFTFSGAEIGSTYNYTISSSGGESEINGLGTISTATDQITGIDVSSLSSGTLTLSVSLTDASNNTGAPATATVEKVITQLPVAVCKDFTAQLAADGTVTITPEDVDGGSYNSGTSINYGKGITFYSLVDTGAFGNGYGHVVANKEPVYFSASNASDGTVRIGDKLHIKYAGGNTNIQDRNIFWRGLNNNLTDVIWEPHSYKSVFVLEQEGKTAGEPLDPAKPYSIKTDFQANGAYRYLSIVNGDVLLNDYANRSFYTIEVVDGSLNGDPSVTYAIDRSTFDCSEIGENKVTLTITNANGITENCTATVKVEDQILPAVVTQNVTVQLKEDGKATITPEMIDNGSSDACGIAEINLNISTFDCSNIGNNTVILTVEDNNGNTNTAEATVTVEDTVDPMIVTENITVQLNAEGKATITPGMIDNGSTDTCGIAEMSLDNAIFDCSNIGDNTVVLTVEDNNGNTSTAEATVTVEDAIAPVVVTKNITVQLDADGKVTISPEMVDNGSTDTCGIAEMSLDITTFDCTNIGDNTVVFTVEDNNGNISTVEATVTVEDFEDPVVVTQNITVQLDAEGNTTITPEMVDNGSADACGISEMSLNNAIFDCSAIGENTVVLTVVDNNGNESSAEATVIVEDNGAPVVVTQNITVQLDAEGNATITPEMVDNGSTDACGISEMTLDNAAFDCGNVGKNNVVLTVKDKNGNQASATATITVEDNVLPSLVTKDFSVKLDENGMASIGAEDVVESATDNCSVKRISLSEDLFKCSTGSTKEVTVTVTDVNGNSTTGVAIVTILDEIAPAVIAKDIVVELDETGAVNITADDVFDDALDNCGIASMSLDNSSFGCAQEGTNFVVLSVTDFSGNIGTAEAIVEVRNSFGDNDIDGLLDNCDEDDDNDGFEDDLDNAPLQYNPEQTDTDSDGLGDIIDMDDDQDGISDKDDNCSLTYNPEQGDIDKDGMGDVCDTIQILVSEAMTPNGDGVNDTWQILNIQNHPNSLVVVFNRWGKEVYRAKAYQNDWNGEHKGELLPEGSYYYQIYLERNKNIDRQGWLYLTK